MVGMNTKQVIRLIFLGAMVLVGQARADETLWAAGVTRESGWNDIDKTGPADSGFCWGIAATNLIAWWQEQHRTEVPPGTPMGKDIWQVFRQSFSNEGSDPDQAIRWWFSGEYTPMQPESSARIIAPEAGGYYRQQELVRGGDVAARLLYCGRSDTVTARSLTHALHSGLRNGDAFWIGVYYYRPDGRRYTHSLNVWGIDCHTKEDGSPCIRAIYMTDSDDRRRHLHRIPLREEAGMLIFDCAGHPLYGPIGRITINTYTGMRLKPLR